MTRVFLMLERLTARMSSTVITLSEGLRAELADEYHITPRSHITVLPLGLDLTPFLTTARKYDPDSSLTPPVSAIPHAPRIGIVGRLVPVKNHALFLQAAALVREKIPDARFVIIGDGELRPSLEALVSSLNLTDSVTFTGWLRDLAPVYATLDVNVISSLNEGTPVSVIESLAAGCPVVATAVGGLPDLLDHGQLGRLVPSGDAQALADAIIAILHNPPDGARAQTLMLERYSIERLVADLDHLYRELLKKQKN